MATPTMTVLQGILLRRAGAFSGQRKPPTSSGWSRWMQRRLQSTNSSGVSNVPPAGAVPQASAATPSASGSSASNASTKRQSRFGKAVAEMKKKPGTHLISFLILHELTAVAPLFPLYYFFQWTDLSITLLGGPGATTIARFTIPTFMPEYLGGGRRVEDVMTEWIDSVARTVARVGSKYGIMGFHKVQQLRGKEKADVEEEGVATLKAGLHDRSSGLGIRSKIADTARGVSVKQVLDGIAAYAVVKALLPVRLAISVSGTPWFASRVIGPVMSAVRRGGSKAQVAA